MRQIEWALLQGGAFLRAEPPSVSLLLPHSCSASTWACQSCHRDGCLVLVHAVCSRCRRARRTALLPGLSQNAGGALLPDHARADLVRIPTASPGTKSRKWWHTTILRYFVPGFPVERLTAPVTSCMKRRCRHAPTTGWAGALGLACACSLVCASTVSSSAAWRRSCTC